MQSMLIVGNLYARKDVAEIIGLPEDRRKGGDWDTGYSELNGAAYIFANVGIAGRTGHDYPNRWESKSLIWSGKSNSARGQPRIERMISSTIPVHVFWRGSERAEFTYAGLARAIEVFDHHPVQVTWTFEDSATSNLSHAATSGEPVWRRGPPPSSAARVTTLVDGTAYLYLMRLTGPVAAVMPRLDEGDVVIKVGRSNDVDRRLAELNAGMPPGGILRWEAVTARTLADAALAHIAETALLEKLRSQKNWIGGEFAIVSEEAVATLLD